MRQEKTLLKWFTLYKTEVETNLKKNNGQGYTEIIYIRVYIRNYVEKYTSTTKSNQLIYLQQKSVKNVCKR